MLLLSPPSSLRESLPVESSAMSVKEVVCVGSVVRRPCAEIVEEMAALAVREKQRMTAPTPPTPQFPGRFQYSRRRARPLRRPINPVPPASPERVFRVAAVTTRDHDEREKYLLEEAEELARRPRTPTPPRRADDHYDLARWSRQRWI